MNILIFIFSTLFSTLSATIINIPADYSTIQAGIDSSADGDTVIVQPNTYFENISFGGHDIVLASLFLMTGDVDYISQTVIDGGNNGSVVVFNEGNYINTVLSGFTIQNGASNFGGGVNVWSSASGYQRISHNIIKNNSSDWGGGVYAEDSHGIFDHCLIFDNHAVYRGGGIQRDDDGAIIVNNCTIVFNTASSQGGGYSSASPDMITNSIIYFNDAPANPNIVNDTGQLQITYSDLKSGLSQYGVGNINTDPLFVDPENHNYSLQPNSLNIDSGDPASPLDPDCTITDMGAFYYHQDVGPCPVLGDLNGDCSLDVVDVVESIYCILNWGFDCYCSDMDGDGQVNIFDVVWMVDLIIN